MKLNMFEFADEEDNRIKPSVGMMFRDRRDDGGATTHNGDILYVLAQVDNRTGWLTPTGRLALICLDSTANRFADPVHVQDVAHLTRNEFRALFNDKDSAIAGFEFIGFVDKMRFRHL